jgi:glutaconate CoA-transferase subunit A
LVEDYTNYQMTLRFMAGAMGVPFLPTRSSLGSDIVNRWGFSETARQADPRVPDRKLVVMDNPFDGWCDTDRVVLVPADQPGRHHHSCAGRRPPGDRPHQGLPFADVEQAKAARHLIVTCETLVDADQLASGAGSEPDPLFLRGCRGACPHGGLAHGLLSALRLRPDPPAPIPAGGPG